MVARRAGSASPLGFRRRESAPNGGEAALGGGDRLPAAEDENPAVGGQGGEGSGGGHGSGDGRTSFARGARMSLMAVEEGGGVGELGIGFSFGTRKGRSHGERRQGCWAWTAGRSPDVAHSHACWRREEREAELGARGRCGCARSATRDRHRLHGMLGGGDGGSGRRWRGAVERDR
ncbi:putative proline-rich receptor-like protein kinase PERK3 [Iris pallida]|uniref:Proline-rich receptor-like protein kinase PERK3 n=1 Tax=Iris pallida TaxID=29817 RepID=A0AAX6G435_IRIPA|nr:putative proline-rich receptor-like protein kinase PERK3 [Iris pallida]